jgi:hypothetical protein
MRLRDHDVCRQFVSQVLVNGIFLNINIIILGTK